MVVAPTTSERFRALRTIDDVAAFLDIPHYELVYVLYRRPRQYGYRVFNLRKKSGGIRLITAPHTRVKSYQRKLTDKLTEIYRPKRSVHGFTQGRTIVTNALQHSGKRWVLNIDLKDFFPSLHFGRVRGILMSRPYGAAPRVATVLAKLACGDIGHLPQGAPSSPIISNMICGPLDSTLSRLARKFNCTYTRYADDITFSTNAREFPPEIANAGYSMSGPGLVLGPALTTAILANNFQVNPDKQHLQYAGRRQEVTGLRVNKFPNVDRRYIRRVRAMLHAWEKFGIAAAQAEFNSFYDRRQRTDNHAPPFDQVVRGHIEFIKMVKGPGDTAFRALATTLNRLAPGFIDAYPPFAPREVDLRWQRFYEAYRDRVFHLTVRDHQGDWHNGTAFAWGSKYVATAEHCLGGEVYCSPPFPEDQPVVPASMIRHPNNDPRLDVALLRLPDSVPLGFWPIRNTPLNVGEQIAAIGYATIPYHEPTVGLYSGIVESKSPAYGGDVDVYQVSVPLGGGLSGGPVFDRAGYLVGTITQLTYEEVAANSPARAYYHVLPVKYLREIPT